MTDEDDELKAELERLDQEMFGSDDEVPPAGREAAIEEAQSTPDGGVLPIEHAIAQVDQLDDPDLEQERQKMDVENGGVDLSTKPVQGPIQEAEPAPTERWAAIKHGLRENETRVPPPSALEEKMKAVGWESKPGATAPKSGPRDWAQLQKDLQDAERSAESTRTVGAMLHAAAPGFQAPAAAGQGDVEAAKAAILGHERLLSESRQQDLDAQNAAKAKLDQEREEQQIAASKAAQDTAANAKLVAEAKEQARNDPASPESQRARAALKPVFEMAGSVPADFDSWTAAQAEQHAKTLVPLATGAAGRKKTEADTAAKETAAGAEATSLEGEKAALAADKRLAKLGVTPEMLQKMDRHGVDKVRDELGKLGKDKGTGAPAKPVHSLDDITDPGDRAKVQAIGEGRADMTIAGLKDRGRIAGLVAQVYPDFDQTKFGAYKSVVQHQATDKDIVAAATAQEHIKQARAHIPQNFDAPVLNRLRKAILSGSGSPEMTPFEVDVKVAADEYAKALGNNAQSGREEVESLIASAQSPQQLAVALDEIDHLLATKQAQWGEQLKKVAPGAKHPAGEPAQLTPSGKPFARKQVSPSTGAVRWLDAAGNVIEEGKGG